MANLNKTNAGEVQNPVNVSNTCIIQTKQLLSTLQDECGCYEQELCSNLLNSLNMLNNILKKSSAKDSSLKKNIESQELFQLEAIQANSDLLIDWMVELTEESQNPSDWNHHDIDLISYKQEKLNKLISLVDTKSASQKMFIALEQAKSACSQADEIIARWNESSN